MNTPPTIPQGEPVSRAVGGASAPVSSLPPTGGDTGPVPAPAPASVTRLADHRPTPAPSPAPSLAPAPKPRRCDAVVLPGDYPTPAEVASAAEPPHPALVRAGSFAEARDRFIRACGVTGV